MDAPHLALGSRGDTLAAAVLERAGYAVIATGYRTAAGEIDIVARDGPCLVFVEVKTRRTKERGMPAEAVTRQKQRRIIAMARDFLARHATDASSCRFDLIAILLPYDGPTEIDHIRNAFDAS
ncbi:MAG TPA: YraN family protein [Arenibaculum sp.]|nr:YraN family protein [Arenibaculum sp.]